jgi:CyaY protein
MNETEFTTISNEILEGIASAIDRANLDIDCSFKGEGILEIEFDDGTKLVINRNTPVR